jgi:twinkle protein
MYANAIGARDHLRAPCVVCGPGRKKERDPCVSVDRKGDWIVWLCHHCGDKGNEQMQTRSKWSEPVYQKPVVRPSFVIDVSSPLSFEALNHLSSRGIDDKTAIKAKLFSVQKDFRSGSQPSIGFPNYEKGKIIGVKYRALTKDFTQEAGSAQIMYGTDWVVEGEDLIITEGEMDCLSVLQSGFSSVVSVPGGAPMKVSDGKIDPSEDKKFAFVWAAKSIIDKAKRIILAVDNDSPGEALREELARRIGKAKCWMVDYPEGCKDLNDVLVNKGVAGVQDCLNNAHAYPIDGLFNADTFFAEVDDLYTKGFGKGESTGYPELDEYFTIVPGQLSVITGFPSHGKSNFVDQLMVNIARAKDWKFMCASFENPPKSHLIKLAEIYTNKPFFDGPTPRMTLEELAKAKSWIQEHFVFCDAAQSDTNLSNLLDRAQAAVQQIGIRGLVIDPYNYLSIDKSGTEAEGISDMLTKVNAFAKSNDVHVFFVAHPAKMLRNGNDLPVPDGMSISGSMAWWAKADVGITVYRKEGAVLIRTWKCRWRWVGKPGDVDLYYDRVAGTYYDGSAAI